MSGVTQFSRMLVWFSLRYMWMHRTRALIVILGISLGAAVFTSVRLSIHASLASFARSVDLFAGTSDFVVLQPGGRLPETILPELIRHPAVKNASAALSAYVQPVDRRGEPFLLIGFDPLLDRGIRSWEVRGDPPSGTERQWLDLLRSPSTLLVSKYLSDRYDWEAGTQLTLEHARRTADFEIIGVLEALGLALVEGGRVAICDIATFQEFTETIGVVDRIDLILVSPGDRSTAARQTELERLLPPGARLEPSSEIRKRGESMIRAYQINLSILSFASLFVGMFLVYSLVALNAASRRHELAILRSTGAGPEFLFRLFLAEGAFLGMIGWLLALPISGLLVRYLLQGVSQTISTLFVRVHVDSLVLDPWEIVLSLGVTVGVSVLAALQPAREAMQVSPKEALTARRQPSLRRRTARQLACLGLPMIAAAWPLSLIPSYGGISMAGYAAMFLLFVGFALLAPFGLEKLGSATVPLLRRRFGTAAYLAGRYVRDSGIRTAVSVGALITAVALFTALVVMIQSFRSTVELWVNQTVSGDLFVTAKMSTLNRFRDPMPRKVIEGLRMIDLPVDIVESRRIALRQGRFEYEMDALDIETFLRHGGFVWKEGSPGAAIPQLVRGDGIVVSEVFANRTGLSVGDRYQTRIGSARIDEPIVGVIRDYRTNGGVVFYDHAAFKRKYFDLGWSGARIFFRDRPNDPDRALAELRRQVIEHCGHHLDMIGGAELRGEILRVFDETFAVTSVLLLIALVIAAMGITTTLAVQVLERASQLNTLIAVGAGRGQIRAMILWESVLLVLAGEFGGLICGFLLSYLLIYVINVQSFGWSFLFHLDVLTLMLSLPLIVATALLAALPAIRLAFSRPPAFVLRER